MKAIFLLTISAILSIGNYSYAQTPSSPDKHVIYVDAIKSSTISLTNEECRALTSLECNNQNCKIISFDLSVGTSAGLTTEAERGNKFSHNMIVLFDGAHSGSKYYFENNSVLNV